jgi:ribokinase
MARVIVFGSINADLIFPVRTLPAPGQTIMAAGMTIEPGGKGANQAAAASRDGAAVVMAGAIGQDGLAATALAGLIAAGVDLSRVMPCSAPTGCASICTDLEGRNQIAVASGANVQARQSAIEGALLTPEAIVVTQMETDPAETAALIRRAHASGALLIHNLAPPAALAPDALCLLDILVVNEDEATWLARHEGIAGDDALALSAKLGVTVVRTLGSAGVEWAGPLGRGEIAAAPVLAVDTTAAGDCFVGVLAAALSRGDSLVAGLRRANAAAGLACTRHGSQSSLPNSTETNAALKQRTPSP